MEINKSDILYKATIFGQPVSKENRRRVYKNKKGKPLLAKSEEACNYAIDFCRQVVWGFEPLTCQVVLYCDMYYRDNRSDLDESLVMDCLQKAGVIKNDRQIKGKRIDHYISKENPRVEIILRERKELT